MSDLDDPLRTLFHDLAGHAPHDPDLATTVRRRIRRRRAAVTIPLAAASVVAVVAAVTVGVLSAGRSDQVASPPGSPVAVSTCGPLKTGPLPDWALSGFSDPTETPPFARSASGDLVAIVFGNPLRADPAAQGPQNKILWVTRTLPQPTDQLTITAQLENSDQVTEIDLHQPPGPSVVDVPAPGCWLMQLRWGEHTDTIALRYEGG